MIIWDEYRWVIYLALAAFVLIVLDEWAYHGWKVANPGSLYSHIEDKSLSTLDPSRPPSTIYQ